MAERQKTGYTLCFNAVSRPADRFVRSILQNIGNYVIMRYHDSFLFLGQVRIPINEIYAYWKARSATGIA
jgi:hypothetical protein